MATHTRAAIGAILAVALAALPGLACTPYRGARLYRSGTAALDRGDVTVAVTDLEDAAALVPEASEVQNHLGLAYAAAGRRHDALLAFRRAVELDCSNAAAEYNLRMAEESAAETKP